MLADRHYQLLTAYVDGELDARQRAAVERLVAESTEARAFLDKLEDDSKVLRDSPQHKAPEPLPDLIMETINHPVPRPPLPVKPAASVGTGSAIPIWLGLALA